MATILAYTSPAIGHLFPMAPVLLELQRRGHDVHVRTLGAYVDELAALGLHATAMDQRVGQITHPDWQVRGPVAGLKSAVLTFSQRGRIDGPDMQQAIDTIDPDLVLVDINAWGAACTAEAWSRRTTRPWAVLSPYTPALRSRGTPPFGPGLPYRDDAVGRLRDALARPVVQGAAERVMRPRINELRAPLGLAPVSSADDFFRRAPLLLVATAEPFEYPHPDWAPQVQMVGALAWEPPRPTPDWVDELSRPVVLVTTSSEYQADEAIVRAAIEGLAHESLDVVATMPSALTDLGPLPDNVHVVDFVPHAALLDRAVVAVTHGGMGATQKALSHGVPVCVVPFGRDQHEVAARVLRAGCGTRVRPKDLTADSLRTAVRAAAERTGGARRVAEGYASAGGASRARDLLEALLTRSRA